MMTHPPTTARHDRRGFSLAELMVVIVILGLLATVVVPRVLDRLTTSQIGIAKTDIVTISNAVTEYAMNNSGKYPDNLEILITPDPNGKKYLDLDVLPTDPWGNQFEYVPPQGTDGFRIICYGKDGAPGGEGDDQDFDNVMIKNKQI